MGAFVIRAAVTGFALWVVTQVVHGLSFVGGDTRLQRVGIIFVVAVIFGLVNAFIKPVVQILSIPLYILTLGLFHIVVNALMLWITAWITENTTHWGLAIDHFWWTAIKAAIVLSIVELGAVAGGPHRPALTGTLDTCPNCPKSKRSPTTCAATPSARPSGASTSPRCRCSRPSTRRSTRCTE